MRLASSRPWLPRMLGLGLAVLGLGLATLPGCDQPTGNRRKIPVTPPAEVVEAPAPAPAPEPPPAPKPILGQKTQDIRDMAKEKQAGGVEANMKITAKDPILLTGNAYVTSIGRIATDNIKHTLDLYQAETGEFPKSHAEFMDNIIKKNNIALPKLPFYQEYVYDVANHKLQVYEYPDRKTQANYPK